MSCRARLIWSLIAGCPVLLFFSIPIIECIRRNDFIAAVVGLVFAYVLFSFISCLILNNNRVGSVISEIFTWGFVTMPGLITTFDLDGLIWLIAMKILFFFIGIALALLAGLFGVFVGLLISGFVYPFALFNIIGQIRLLKTINDD